MIKCALTIACVLAAGAASAQQPAPAAAQPPAAYGPAVTLQQAEQLIAAGRAEAARRNFTMAFAVVDPNGDLVSFEKMDGTQFGSIDVALAKARSSARFKRPSKAFSDAVASGRVSVLGVPGAMPIEGGVLIVRQNRIVGALGVSGGTAVEDGEVAAVALAALR